MKKENDYRCVLFDLDGTLTDSAPGIINSIVYALRKFNIEVEDRSTLYSFVGPPLIESFMKYFDFTKEQAVTAVVYYREYFAVTGIFENSVYDGIPELLEGLKKAGKKLVLATSKPQEFAERILEHFGLAHYFDFVFGATMDEKRTKKTDVIAYAYNELRKNLPEVFATDAADEKTDAEGRKKMIMVGDRENDITGATCNGIASIGVLYGFGSLEELEEAGAGHIAATPADVLTAVLSE